MPLLCKNMCWRSASFSPHHMGSTPVTNDAINQARNVSLEYGVPGGITQYSQ